MTKFRWVSGTRVQSIIHAEGVRCRGCGSVRTNVWLVDQPSRTRVAAPVRTRLKAPLARPGWDEGSGSSHVCDDYKILRRLSLLIRSEVPNRSWMSALPCSRQLRTEFPPSGDSGY